jgi:hypothetical protein
MFFNTLIFGAQTKTFLLSSMKNKFISEIFNNIVFILLEFVKIEIFNALMASKVCSCVFLVANLTHNKYFRAFITNVLLELSTSLMLEFWAIADVATKFGTIKLSMGL